MKRLLFCTGLLSLLTLVTSCQKDSLNEPVLNLSVQTDLKVEYKASEIIVGIETNQVKWAAVAHAPWLQATPAGNNLVITTTENSDLAPRQGTISISGGGILRTLIVEQSGNNILDLGVGNTSEAPTIQLTKDGGEARYVIRIASDAWTATSDAEWLDVIALPRAGELLVNADSNETIYERNAQIKVSVSGSEATINVTQEGHLHFYLPHNLWGRNFIEVEALEKKRGSKHTGTPIQDNNTDIPYYTFSTVSAAFPTVRYEFNDYGTDFLYATTLISPDATLVYSKAFLDFLTAEGFKRISPAEKTSGLLEYLNEEKKTSLYIYAANENGKLVGYVYLYPTFEQEAAVTLTATFDPGFTKFGTGTLADVQAWEAQNSGQYDSEFSALLKLPFWFVPDPLFGRGYFFNEGDTPTVQRTLLLYTNPAQAFFKYGGISRPTAEWNKMLAGLGYEYNMFNPIARTHIYVHRKKMLGVEMAAITLVIHPLVRTFVYSIGQPSTSSTRVAQDDLEKINLKASELHRTLTTK